MIQVLLLPYLSAVMLPTAWCLEINFVVFINLSLTHTHTYTHYPVHAYSLLCCSRNFWHYQFHFLAGAQTGNKGKMGIQQPLSSPILFHLQKTNFSSYLIYKIMINLVMQWFHTQLYFPSISAGTRQRKFLYSLLTSI